MSYTRHSCRSSGNDPQPLDDAPDVDGGALQPSLTLADIDALHARIDAYVDQLVAAEKARMPNQPAQVLRALLVRGQCTCAAGRRLLQEREHG